MFANLGDYFTSKFLKFIVRRSLLLLLSHKNYDILKKDTHKEYFMKNIKFIKEPRYTYDLFFLFALYFNKEYCLTNFINYNKSSEDTDYFNKLLLDFSPIPEDLLPFFFLRDDKKSFMTQYYYEPYMKEFTTTYNLSSVQEALSDYDRVITNLIKFYFIGITHKELEECKNSMTAMSRLIKNSKYSGDLKSSLYAFFLEPVPVIQKLSYELIAKDFLLSQKYEKDFRKMAEFQNQLDFEQLALNLKKHKDHDINIGSFDDVYISVVVVFKNCVKTHYYDNKLVILLGIDSDSYIDYIIMQNSLPELDVFGNALSEKNRIEILDLIVRKNEITLRDIEQELGFAGTNGYYHLSFMIKANMIRARNQGRSVLYSINKRYFDAVCEMLSKYSNKMKGDNRL